MIGDTNNETNFPHRLLLTDRQVSKLQKGFANNSLANIKLSMTQMFEIVQSGGFLGSLIGPLIKVGLLLMKIALTPLTKEFLFHLD